MADNMKKSEELVQSDATKARREFLKTAGKFGITAPMAALLLSVDSKRAEAQPMIYAEINNNGMTMICGGTCE